MDPAIHTSHHERGPRSVSFSSGRYLKEQRTHNFIHYSKVYLHRETQCHTLLQPSYELQDAKGAIILLDEIKIETLEPPRRGI